MLYLFPGNLTDSAALKDPRNKLKNPSIPALKAIEETANKLSPAPILSIAVFENASQ